MNIGQRIKHPVYGEGTIIHLESMVKMGDNNNWDRGYQSSISRTTLGYSRYEGNLNVSVKFDNGGPQGFAINASNDVKDLQVIE